MPGTAAVKNIAGTSVKVHNHLSTKEINNAINESKLIISRSGYTTIMDLVNLQKSAVLVPTPGQTEQEYLAGYLSEKKYFYTVRQEDFSLEKVLINFEKSSLLIPVFPADDYKKIITSLPGLLNKKL
ncbi:MAG: hypothetical protein IPJ81_15560 [Chitinophagaceae bacterium]|nr:hypothetical protein [Chitinophagaceae bacterium]